MHRGFTIGAETPRAKATAAKRARYAELRQQGKTSFEAALEIGVDVYEGAKRYERWYQAFPPPEVTP